MIFKNQTALNTNLENGGSMWRLFRKVTLGLVLKNQEELGFSHWGLLNH